MTLLQITTISLGIVILLIGTDQLTMGAGGLVRKLGVPPFLVGLTVAAAITSIPEIFVSVRAALHGNVELSISTAIGSNIANIGLILGITFLIANIKAVSETLLKASMTLVAITALTISLLLDNQLSREDGFVLIAGCFIVNIWALQLERPEGPIYTAYDGEHGVNVGKITCAVSLVLGMILVGLSLWLMDISAELLKHASQNIFGLFPVAIVTSLPELLACIVSTLKREYEFALGIVIGSNVINLTLGLGLASVIQPSFAGSDILALHTFVLIAFSLVLLAMTFEFHPDKKRNFRGEGMALIVAYSGYLVYTVIQHGGRPA